MAITRAKTEEILVRRTKKRLAFVGMDAVTVNGTNADLNDALADALRGCGLSASDTVTDADVSAVAADDLSKFLDLAELRLLETIHGNVDLVDIEVGQRRESLGQFADQVDKAITRLSDKCRRSYGIGAGSISAGVLAYDFQQKEGEGEWP